MKKINAPHWSASKSSDTGVAVAAEELEVVHVGVVDAEAAGGIHPDLETADPLARCRARTLLPAQSVNGIVARTVLHPGRCPFAVELCGDRSRVVGWPALEFRYLSLFLTASWLS